MSHITLNGRQIVVSDGQTVIQAADANGIEIPRFCYHESLPPAANCRMCLVEVEGVPKLLTACDLPVKEGMVVHTDSEKVRDAQKDVLELLLINHPLDCPICDKAGECPLQDQYFKFSGQPSDMQVPKVRKPKRVDLGPTIKLDDERCVLCTRCIRFMDLYAGDHALGIANRGNHSVLRTFPGLELDNVYSLNTVDLCPVGALTSKDFRFKKRVWYLKHTPSVCPFCANGCNIQIEVDENHVYRIRPRTNPEVNGWFMCDTGRLEYGYLHGDDRLTRPQVRAKGAEGGELVPSDWGAALDAACHGFKESEGTRAVLWGPGLSNESLYLAARVASDGLATERLASLESDRGPVEGRPADDFLIKADKNPNTRGVKEMATALGAATDGFEGLCKDLDAGKVGALLVADPHLLNRAGERAESLRDKLGKARFIVLLGTHGDELCDLAHVIFPVTLFAEEEGTFTRYDGRVQRYRAALKPPGEARTTTSVLHALGTGLEQDLPGPAAPAVFSALTRKVPFFEGLSYSRIGDQGAMASGCEPQDRDATTWKGLQEARS